MSHFVSKACEGEVCRMCGKPATHKIAEEIPFDHPTNHPDPIVNALDKARMRSLPDAFRHELTAYVCCHHFWRILGSAVECVLAGKITLGPDKTDVVATEVALRKAIRDLPGAVGDIERQQIFDLINVWSEKDLGVDG